MVLGTGLLVLLIGACVWAAGAYYIWLGRPDDSGSNPIYKGWRQGGRVSVFLGRLTVSIGVLLTTVGIVVELL